MKDLLHLLSDIELFLMCIGWNIFAFINWKNAFKFWAGLTLALVCVHSIRP
jgi:hypothetical protein